MAPGHTLKGYLPGDASGGTLPAAMADLPLAFGTLEEHAPAPSWSCPRPTT